jgi:chemotaxis protein CheD
MVANVHDRHQLGSSLGVERRGVERINGLKVTTLYSGEYYVTDNRNEMIETILGSCVAACMHDPVSKVGGMNHFLLPDSNAQSSESEGSARYGVFAMEQLINGIMKLGGLKQRLEVKVFGGGNVINNSAMIGSKNVAFVREFLAHEGLRITGADLGADYPRRVRFCPDTGKAMMLKLQRKDDLKIADVEKKFASTLQTKPIEGDIELF